MKYVIAIIQPDRLDEVMAELEAKEINLITVSDVMGRGRQKGVAEVYRSHVERGGLLRKTKIEIAVNDDFLAADHRGDHHGSPHRQRRRRQDLRLRPGGVRAHPHRRDRWSGHRLTTSVNGCSRSSVGARRTPGPTRIWRRGRYSRSSIVLTAAARLCGVKGFCRKSTPSWTRVPSARSISSV